MDTSTELPHVVALIADYKIPSGPLTGTVFKKDTQFMTENMINKDGADHFIVFPPKSFDTVSIPVIHMYAISRMPIML